MVRAASSKRKAYLGFIVCPTFIVPSAWTPEHFVSDERKGQEARLKFYNSQPVIRYLQAVGIPKRTGEFRDMVAAGSTVKLDSKEGSELIETLGRVVFSKHPQQINISDDTNGKTIASIPV